MEARRGETPPAARCAARQRGRHSRRRTKTPRLNAGNTESRRASESVFSKPTEAQSCLRVLPLNRGAGKSQKRIGEQTQIWVYVFGDMRVESMNEINLPFADSLPELLR
jgi:hypothetical protein